MTSEKLNCKQVSRLLSDGLDRELPAPERAKLRLHLAICGACRELEKQFGFLRQVLRRIEPAERARRRDEPGSDAPPDA